MGLGQHALPLLSYTVTPYGASADCRLDYILALSDD
jgi:hypothetical protein